MSPTNARNGSIEILRLASSVHSRIAAINSCVDNGIRNRDSAASKAPATKYGRRRPSRPSQVRSSMWPMTGWASRPVRGAATQRAGRLSTLEPTDWKLRLMFAFCNANPIWIPKKPNEMFHSPARLCRGFSRLVAWSISCSPGPCSHVAPSGTTSVAEHEPACAGGRLARPPFGQSDGEHQIGGPAAFDRLDQCVDQRFGGGARVLRDRGQRRACQAGGRNVVEADHRNLRDVSAGLLERMHRPDRSDVACSEDRIKIDAAGKQLFDSASAVGLVRRGIDLEALVGLDSRGVESAAVAPPPFLYFGEAGAGSPDEGDPAPSLLQQMGGGLEPATLVVRRDGHPNLPVAAGTPTNEMRAAGHELLELRAIFEIVAIAEEDDPVGLAAVLIIDVPVGRQLLDRNQQIVPARSATSHHRADQRKIEGVEDSRFRPFLEEQQRQRLGALPAQARGVLVDLVVKLLDGFEHALAGLFAHRWIARQRA